MKRYFTLLLFFLAVCGAFAQNINYQQQYLRGKELFREGNYALARETFKPIIPKNPSNPFSEYATFYGALAAYYDGHPAAAREMLLQARERFPGWSKMDEVHFWIAKIYFESEDTYLALNSIKSIKGKDVKSEGDKMAYHFLSENNDVFELKAFYEDYPNNAILGRVLAEKIAAQPLKEQDKELMNQLIRKFDLDPGELLIASVDETVYKDSYRIAVMLPFMVGDLNANDRRRPNQFVLDFYQGLRMAIDSLKNQGMPLELYAYDTKRDSITTAQILARKELQTMDLIVGPLYPQPASLVSQFSLEHKINMVNPLSNSVEFTGNNPYVFLFNPSVATIGETAAQYSWDNFRKGPGVVFFGDTRNDRIMAEAFADSYNEQGGKLLMVHQVDKDNSREILDILLAKGAMIKDISNDTEKENELYIPRDSLSFIFVASDNSLIFSKVVSAVETRGDEVEIIGSAGWLEIPVVKYEVFERLKTRFYAPSYISYNSPAYQSFRSRYIKKHRTLPTEYAAKGYELGLFFGRNLKENGKYPQAEWAKGGKQKGVLTSGYQFSGSQDNQVVPFLEFGQDGLDIILRERKTKDQQ